VPGLETAIQFSNAVYSAPDKAFPECSVDCDLGKSHQDAWVYTPTAAQVGDHPLTFSFRDPVSKTLLNGSTTIRVVPKNAGENEEISLLIMGDSLTNATRYPNEIARLLSLPGNPRWKMIGTHRPGSAKEGVVHEGYGGWTWARFVSKYEAGNEGAGKLRNSPFLFPDAAGEAELDVRRYLQLHADGKEPDFVTIMLGINDCFHPDPKNPEAIEARIDLMMGHAETLLAAIRKGSPASEIGLCLTTPGNSRNGAFVANYKDRYTRDGWKKIQYRLVERQLADFGNRESDNIYIIPTALHLDTTGGYPHDNGVHPNELGYNQIAADIYGWIKWRIAEREVN
jgi:lysophospholipase L1-like esterase